MNETLYWEQDGDIGMDWAADDGDVLSMSLRDDGRLVFAVILSDGQQMYGDAQLVPEAFEVLAKLIPTAEGMH